MNCSDCGSNNGHWADCPQMPADHAGKIANFKKLFEGYGEVFNRRTIEDEMRLDAVAQDLTAGTNGCPEEGLRYRDLPVEQRIIVMQLMYQRGIDASLDNIDTHLSHVAHWFELSKIYHP